VSFAAPHERAGVLSIVFIVSYVSMGVPAIAAGALVARHGNILGTAKEFGVVVMTLALAALLASGLRMAMGRLRKSRAEHLWKVIDRSNNRG
jgi:hypothetical protein